VACQLRRKVFAVQHASAGIISRGGLPRAARSSLDPGGQSTSHQTPRCGVDPAENQSYPGISLYRPFAAPGTKFSYPNNRSAQPYSCGCVTLDLF
jgi:hypothetical protein